LGDYFVSLSELPRLIEGMASCFTEAFNLSTGLNSDRSNPTNG